MKPEDELPLGDISEEVSALIATLHDTQHRLEVLTEGEVDTVADRDGRSFLLRRAQEQLRHSEAAKQAAILNALPAHIAMLDARGVIVSVNEAWRKFPAGEAIQGPGQAVGLNYPEICESAWADDAADCRRVAEGIRSVLSGEESSFEIEYSSHTATQQRWFLMTVNPLQADRPNGVVVMHLDVTARKRDEAELRRFASAMDATADAIYLVDRSSMRFVHVNDAACRMQGRTRDALVALGPEGVLSLPRAELERTYDSIIASGVDAEPLEMLRRRRDGTDAWVELRRHALHSEDGWTIVTLVRDVTERKQAEDRITRLNRVQAMLSGINTLIVRVTDREELFREACRIAVEHGGFRMTWIGIVDKTRMELRPVASAGTTSDFHSLVNQRFSLLEEEPRGNILAARAIRDKVASVSNDVRTDPRVVFKDEHEARGSRSMVILPLVIRGEVVGLLTLYAGETGFFDDEEMKLLTELAGDVAFAVDHLKRARKLARMTRMNAVLSDINGAIVRIRDRDALFEEACRIAVETGALPFAWLGVLDASESKLQLIASAGCDEGFLQSIRERLALRDDTPETQSLSWRAIRQRRAVVVNDIAADAILRGRKAFAAQGIRSVAVFPLLVAGRVAGAFALHSEEVGFFDDDELRLLSEIAANIAFALEHMEKEEKVLRLTRVYAVLSGITALTVHVRDRQELFNEACRIAVSTGGFHLARVIEVDPAGTARIAASTETDTSRYQGTVDEYNADPENSVSLLGLALRDRQPLVSNDVATDARLKNRAALARDGSYALSLLPLFAGQRLAGTLVLRAPIGAFNDDENRLLLELTANVSLGLERIEQEERLGRMTRVNAMLSGVNAAIVRIRDRQELLQEACRIAVDTGDMRFAWMSMVDEKEKRLRPVASAGGDGARRDLLNIRLSLRDDAPEGYGLAARSIREQRALVTNDIAMSDEVRHKQLYFALGVKSIAALPLMAGNRPIGGFVLNAAETGFFDEDEMRLLGEVTANIAFALEHIEKEEKVERLTRVYAVSSGITSLIVHVDNREELFREACRIAVEHGKFAMAWIGAFDAQTQDVTPVAWAGEAAGELTRMASSARADTPRGTGAVGQSIRARRPIFSNSHSTQDIGSPRLQEIKRLGFESRITLPLYENQAIVATLTLYTKESGFFDEAEVRLLTELAADISFALENISRRHKLARMTRVNAVLSGINALIVRARDRDELFDESCRIAVDSGKFVKAWIGTIDPASRQFRMVAAHGGDPRILRTLEREMGKNIAAGKGLAARAIATLQPVVSNDAVSDPALMLRDAVAAGGVQSIAVLPLVVSGAVVGVLSLNSDTTGFFDSEEMALLAELARNIAFAVDHIGQQDRLDYFAYYDELTGLANRTLFLERLAQNMRSAVAAGHKLALFFLDLERFRNINDSLGRQAGDAILKQVAEWLIRNVGDASLLARVGGDHFAIVLPEVKQEGNVARLLDKRIRAFQAHQFSVEDTEFRLTLRAGVALFPNDGTDAATLLGNAEAALKNAKTRGDRLLFYTQKMTEAVAGKLTLESRLRRALDNEEFVLHYQPKVSLESGKLTSAEALIRWNDPQTGLVPPGKFIPLLEETGLIYDVGRWALRKAISEYLRWRAAGLPAVRIAVNVSPLQLRNRGFVAEVQHVIGIDPLAAAGLEIEITESVIMEDVKNSIASLQAIRAMGVTIAIDDFGTGFSSLSHLARLPVDALKIDRSFVTEMTSEAKGLSLVSTIISLAHALKLKVVAEGVETEEQSRLLRLLRCDEMQGFLFSKPVPAETFERTFLASPTVA